MFPPERAVNYSSLRPAQISVQSISARVNKKSGKDETFYLKSFFKSLLGVFEQVL